SSAAFRFDVPNRACCIFCTNVKSAALAPLPSCDICAKPRQLGIHFFLPEVSMADHGKVEYATATGNDLVEHESTYKSFVQLAYVGSALCASIAIALAIGGTT